MGNWETQFRNMPDPLGGKTIAQLNAEAVIEAIQREVRVQERNVRDGQELRLYFSHGDSLLRVFSVAQRGNTVAVLECRDGSGYDSTVLTPLAALTLMCRVETLPAPEKPHKIGFSTSENSRE